MAPSIFGMTFHYKDGDRNPIKRVSFLIYFQYTYKNETQRGEFVKGSNLVIITVKKESYS